MLRKFSFFQKNESRWETVRIITVLFIKNQLIRICLTRLIWYGPGPSMLWNIMSAESFYFLLVFNFGYKVRKSNKHKYLLCEAQLSLPHISFVLSFLPSLKKITNYEPWWACSPRRRGSGGGSRWENELLLALPFLFSYRLVLTITSFFVPYLWAK